LIQCVIPIWNHALNRTYYLLGRLRGGLDDGPGTADVLGCGPVVLPVPVGEAKNHDLSHLDYLLLDHDLAVDKADLHARMPTGGHPDGLGPVQEGVECVGIGAHARGEIIGDGLVAGVHDDFPVLGHRIVFRDDGPGVPGTVGITDTDDDLRVVGPVGLQLEVKIVPPAIAPDVGTTLEEGGDRDREAREACFDSCHFSPCYSAFFKAHPA